MDQEAFFARYADVVAAIGLNIQPGQEVVVRAPVEAAEFVPHFVRAALKRGARSVIEIYRNQASRRAYVESASDEALEYVPPGEIAERMRIATAGGAVLAILGDDPRGLEGVDSDRAARNMRANAAAATPIRRLQMADRFPWCVISVPTQVWASRVFPDMGPDEALQRLRDAVATACRLDRPDPVAEWEQHRRQLSRIAAWLTEQQFDHLSYDAPGTTLTVGLPARHRWVGTDSSTPDGQPFVANLPTDEVFTAPDYRRAEGTFRTTRPVVYAGTVIEQIDFTVRGGRIISARASNDQAVIDEALEIDENARALGEVALVAESAPVARTGLTFLDGLYDENAGCHIAFGAAYAICHQDGSDLDETQLVSAGLNQSTQHHDVTVGSPGLSVVAHATDGAAVPLIVDGEWSDQLVAVASQP